MTETKITNDQISTLRSEAGQAGDLEMVAICDQAIAGDESARNECADVIAAAQAMDDSE